MLQGERTDTDLVHAVTGGDSSAYGELFDRWFNSSWNVARNILRDDDLAADVAQDALLNAWQRLDPSVSVACGAKPDTGAGPRPVVS